MTSDARETNRATTDRIDGAGHVEGREKNEPDDARWAEAASNRPAESE
jgi:hypothetical protein